MDLRKGSCPEGAGTAPRLPEPQESLNSSARDTQGGFWGVCAGSGAGLDNLDGSFPTQTIPRFYRKRGCHKSRQNTQSQNRHFRICIYTYLFYLNRSFFNLPCFFMLSHIHLLNKSIYKVGFPEIYITFTF